MPRRSLFGLLVPAALSTLAACGGHASFPDGGPAAPTGPHALWSSDPQSLANPLPDGRLVSLDAGVALRPSFWQPFVPAALVSQGGATFTGYMQQLAGTLAGSQGFGNYGAELVPFSEPPDPASLSQAFAYVALGAAAAKGPPAVVSFQTALDFAVVRPSLPLAVAASYALVLTDAATVPGGAALARSVDFDGWARGSGAATVAQLATALQTTPAHIIFADVFTTQDARADLEKIASWVAQPLATFPTLVVPPTPLTSCSAGPSVAAGQCPAGVFSSDAGTISTLDPWFNQQVWESPPTEVGTVVVGTVPLQDMRDGEDGHFVPSSVDNPDSARTVQRQFVLAVPDPAKVSMPQGGWPMVVAGHGLGGGNSVHEDSNGKPLPSFCLANAEFLAEAGYGCLGLDAPSHQSRGSSALFFNVQDLGVTRDYFREAAVDMMQLMRIASAWPAGQDGVTIDPTRLSYFGESLGGIMGANFISLDPRVTDSVLLVPGGGLTTILQSPNIEELLGLLIAANMGVSMQLPDGTTDPNFIEAFPLIQTLGQVALEPGDPINYAPTFAPSKHALILEGLNDQTIPNLATDDLAAAFGFPTLTAATSSAQGVDGLWKYDLTHYGFTDVKKDNPHGVFELVSAARDQAGAYLKSFGTVVNFEK